jgi:TolA-binding protein
MQPGNLDGMLAALREEPEPVDELTRARWLGKLGPRLDQIDEQRRPRTSRRWVAAGGLAVIAAAAAYVMWPHAAPAPAPAVALERARLHPYVVSGASAEAVAPTLLAGRFASLDVHEGELVRAELDGDRLALVGPARLDVTRESEAVAEVAASGTLLVDARASRPLVLHAGALTLRAQQAVFAASAATATVYVERGTVELGDTTLHAGDWSGSPDARLVAMLRDHEHAIAPGADGGGIIAVAEGSPVTTASGDVLGAAPLWARVAAGQLIVQIGADRHALEVRPGQLSRVPLPVAVAPAPPPLPVVPAPPPPPKQPAPARVAAAPIAPIAPAAVEPTPAPEPDASQLYARADAALGHGDPGAAEAALDELLARFPDSPQASQALYDLAQLAHRRGDLARAREDLTRLLAGSPPDALAEPARYLACRLDVDSQHADAAAACFTAFRASFPRSTHDRDVLAWLAGHAREAGGCAAARAASAEYLQRYPTGPFAARAKECVP